MLTPDLVRRFLQGACTEEEKAQLRAWFTRYPEAWDQYLTLEEWEAFEPVADPGQEQVGRWWKRIRQTTAGRPWRQLTVAAGILLVAAIGWKLWTGRARSDRPAAPVASVLQRQFNEGRTSRRLFMEDGTTVDLQPGSEIRYQEPFARGGRRIVYLEGEASFDAAQDPAHPMQVYSGALVTTVLGTSFTVEAYEKAPYIRVALHTGKVRVSVDTASERRTGAATDVVMHPGQELWYNKQSMLATIREPKRKDAAKPSTPGVPDWYMFNNQSLAQVFDQLSEMYDVKIVYNDSEVKGLYFIAKFEKTDSLEEIMRDIALLNGLTIRKQDNTYIVKRKSH
ncbi:MAG TPA: FecR domain-containing protein [Dinghuibacter sp.]|uniref:FecR family protein n=1 Tax=Dinghuibacter sp. TaxID=2024697 RepID=UPI002CAAA1B4|nr:FecR domain-containing protein [Dinghuibacter sp.]HTJ14049.1 FecR domain-containing protein [Dinghuibacter sp.]